MASPEFATSPTDLQQITSEDQPRSLKFILKQPDIPENSFLPQIVYNDSGSNPLNPEFQETIVRLLVKHSELQRHIELVKWRDTPLTDNETWVLRDDFTEYILQKINTSLQARHDRNLIWFKRLAMQVIPQQPEPSELLNTSRETLDVTHTLRLMYHILNTAFKVVYVPDPDPVPEGVVATIEKQEYTVENHIKSIRAATEEWFIAYHEAVEEMLDEEQAAVGYEGFRIEGPRLGWFDGVMMVSIPSI